MHARPRTTRAILTLNGGSSSLKCALFTFEAEPQVIARHAFDGDYAASLGPVQSWIHACAPDADVVAVGHRVVHGGTAYVEPQVVTPEMIARLRSLVPFAPNHLPPEIALMEAAVAEYSSAAHCASFDTAFHASMPEIARRLPLAPAYAARGIQKYGFHGLSYAFLVEELRRVAGAGAADGRVILAHLGNGSSLAAVHQGRSADTTMGLTPIGGVMMGTRTGDLDPGVVTYIARTDGLSADAVEDLLSRDSGLVGVSRGISDMKMLLEREARDASCRLALDMYVYSIAKAVGALCAVLGGVETIVFSGGIGEHASSIRARILQRLTWLGIDVDGPANDANASVISSDASRVSVRVIPTDEERMIARATFRLASSHGRHDD